MCIRDSLNTVVKYIEWRTKIMNWAKVALFAGGALFGSAGIEILTSKDAKKLYTCLLYTSRCV